MAFLLGACAPSVYMAALDERSYTATLQAVPAWTGSPIRVVVGPTVHYWRSVQWDDIGHSYGLASDVSRSDGIEIEIVNQTDRSIEIDWASSSFVDAEGAVRSIVHRGSSASDRLESQAPTAIPKRGRVSDVVYPRNSLAGEEGFQNARIYLPTDISGSRSWRATLVLAAVVGDSLVPCPVAISLQVAGTRTVKKWGGGWPTLLASCNPMVGCASGLTCEETIDFRCVPIHY